MYLRTTPKAFVRLALSIAALMVVLVGAGSWWLSQAARELSAKNNHEQIIRTSQGVMLALVDDWVVRDYGAMENTLKRAFSSNGLVELTLTDLHGSVISSVIRSSVDATPVARFDHTQRVVPKSDTHQYVVVNSEMQHWLPIQSGTHMGWLYTVMRDPTAEILLELGHKTLRLAIAVSVIMFLVFFLVLQRTYLVIAQSELGLINENEQLGNQIQQDALTGLLNRYGFHDRLNREIKRLQRTPNDGLAVCFMDMDDFKLINDKFGHAVGDEVLRVVARRLHSSIKSTDVAGRYGGDEFVMILNHVSQKSAIDAILGRLQAIMEEVIDVAGLEHPLKVRFSIGATLYPANRSDAATLIAHADEAMYQAKQNGGHTWRYWQAKETVSMPRV